VGADPCELVVLTREEAEHDGSGSQLLWCHARCLRQVVHPSIPVLATDATSDAELPPPNAGR
jgi:hypothetical protein